MERAPPCVAEATLLDSEEQAAPGLPPPGQPQPTSGVPTRTPTDSLGGRAPGGLQGSSQLGSHGVSPDEVAAGGSEEAPLGHGVRWVRSMAAALRRRAVRRRRSQITAAMVTHTSFSFCSMAAASSQQPAAMDADQHLSSSSPEGEDMAAVPAVALLSDEWEAVVLHLHPKAAMALAITSVHMLVVVGAAILTSKSMDMCYSVRQLAESGARTAAMIMCIGDVCVLAERIAAEQDSTVRGYLECWY